MSTPTLFDTVDALVAGIPLTPAKVAAALGARLERDADSNTAAVQAWALSPKVRGGPYEAVDLRMPDELMGDGTVFLNLTLRGDGGLGEDEIVARYGDDFRMEVPSPRYEPGTVPAYLVYEHDWGSLSFGVGVDDARRLVRIVMSSRAE